MTEIVKGKALRLSTEASTVPPGGTLPSLPLIDLMGILAEHADAMSYPPNPARFPRPRQLSDRMLVPRSHIVAGRWQPRTIFADPEITSLAESIQEVGIITPLIVFVNEAGRFELIAGERRLRAAEIVGLSMIPVEIREGTPAELEDLSVIDNLQRENLTPWEEGQAFERIISGRGWSEAELSRRMGKNRAYIQQRRALATATPELCQALAEDAISFGVARGIIAGSAGDLAVQKAGLKAVLADIKAGKSVKEDGARAATAKHVLEVHRAALESRGWKICTYLGGVSALVIYAQTERPRFVTEKELIDLATSGATPAAGDGPAPWDEDADTATVIRERGINLYQGVMAPWLYLVNTDKGSSKPQITFASGEDMPGHARAAQADIDALEARATAIGWQRRRVHSAVQFVKDGQKTSTVWDWPGQLKLLDELEAGTAVLIDRNRCPLCEGWLDEGPQMHLGGQVIHAACKEKAIAAERQAILAEPAQQNGVTIPPWVHHIPEDALRALVSFLSDNEWADNDITQVRVEFAEFIQIALDEYAA